MSRKTGYQPKTRNSYQRKRKSVVLLAAEGKNKTETQYFKSIPSPDHVIRFAPGNYTDPVNMVYALRKEYEELELDAELGDAAFCLVDSDVDSAKDRQLEKADTEAGNRIRVVVSSPCFEVWYLEHFGYTSKPLLNSDEVIKELRKSLPEYMKNHCDYIIWRMLFIFSEVA